MHMYTYMHICIDVIHDNTPHIPTILGLPTMQSIESTTQNICIFIHMHMYTYIYIYM